MNLKKTIKTWKIYSYYIKKRYFTERVIFENRSNNKAKMCMMLSGYKNFLIPAVFGRLKKYATDDMDICIITSGLYSKEISEICAKNGWSYLSQKRNNVSLAQNTCINLFPNAKYIFKLDEDIFITEGYFENMLAAYNDAKLGEYDPGVIAPMIPINGFGHLLLLKKLGLDEIYKAEFERPIYMTMPHRMIENSSDVARFMWGESIEFNGKVIAIPSIDSMNKQFSLEKKSEVPCPIRFSIGAILFERELWENMGYFHVRSGNQMGEDEMQLCEYCCNVSRPLMVSENIVVGHLSFGPQNQAMKDYYFANKNRFM